MVGSSFPSEPIKVAADGAKIPVVFQLAVDSPFTAEGVPGVKVVDCVKVVSDGVNIAVEGVTGVRVIDGVKVAVDDVKGIVDGVNVNDVDVNVKDMVLESKRRNLKEMN